MLFLFITCEDRPCRTDVENPFLDIAFFEHDLTDTTEIPVKVRINFIELYNSIFTDTLSENSYITSLQLPVLPDSGIMKMRIEFEKVMRFKDTIKIDLVIDDIDTTFKADTIFSIDTTYIDDTIPTVDTFYLSDFSQSLNVNYTTKILPVSPECGFSYEYIIDSVSYYGLYIDTISIENREINVYENSQNHIYIYF